MIVWELHLGILGVGEHLRHVLGTGIAERQHALRFFRFEILEFRQPVVLVIVRAGDTGHLEIGTSRRIVLLDGERIAAAQVTGTKLEEGATDEILVDLVEHLRRELTEVLLEVVLHQRLKTTLLGETLVSGDIALGISLDMIHLVVIVHVDAAHREVGQHHAVNTPQRGHAQIKEADRIDALVEEFPLVELAGQVGNVIGQLIIDHQGVQHLLGVLKGKSQTTDPTDIRTQVLIHQLTRDSTFTNGEFLEEIGQDRGIEQGFGLRLEAITIVIIHDQLPNIIEPILPLRIGIQHVTQVDLRFLIREAQHTQEFRFQGQDLRYIISACQVIHRNGKNPRAETGTDTPLANTRLDHLEEGAQETVLRGYLLIEQILVGRQ